jgi:hypothetical protein
MRRQDTEARRLIHESQLKQQLNQVEEQVTAKGRQVEEVEKELAVRRRFYEENAPPEIRRQLPRIFGDDENNAGRFEDLDED